MKKQSLIDSLMWPFENAHLILLAAPFALLGMVAHKLTKWTVGAFMVGWKASRDEE